MVKKNMKQWLIPKKMNENIYHVSVTSARRSRGV